MLISSLVAQEGGGGIDFIWFLLPLLCCMMAGQRGGKPPESRTATESWYTVQDIEATYSAIEERAAEWREEAEASKPTSGSLVSKLRGALGGRRDVERFVEKETSPPRLYQMVDSTGPIYFELTEVEGRGTVVKTSYNPYIKVRMAKFKADLPLKIPATPIGHRCPSCGKPVLPEFSLCPYCGEKMIEE